MDVVSLEVSEDELVGEVRSTLTQVQKTHLVEGSGEIYQAGDTEESWRRFIGTE